MAALEIKWESVERITKASAPVVTGESAPTSTEPAVSSIPTDRPLVVFVCDGACEGFDKLQEVVFKAEKVALGMKAFRAVKMSSDDANAEPLLADTGKEVPRLVVYDPVKQKATVLDKSKLTAGGLFAAMRKVSDSMFEQKLDVVVKDHLKLLTDRDQLSNEVKVITEKETRLKEEADKNKKDLEELAKKREEVQAELEGLAKKERELWKFTLKAKPA